MTEPTQPDFRAMTADTIGKDLLGAMLAELKLLPEPWPASPRRSRMTSRDNPPAVIIDDANLIPADYMREPVIPPPAPDKNLIKKALTDGFVVPGAHLERGRRLEIK